MPKLNPFGKSMALAAALATAVPAAAQAPTPSPGIAFPSDVEVVTVDVVVLDQAGQPVEGLQRGDFVVKEDGKPQALATFDAVRVPESVVTAVGTTTRSRVSVSTPPGPIERTFVIVFDDANLTQYRAAHARDAVSTFIRDGLRPGDQVTVVPTAGGAWWTGRIPEDRDSLLAYVVALKGKFMPPTGPDRIWDHEAMAIWMGRDPQVLSYVARRWFDNNLMPEGYPSDREVREGLNVSPGLAMIRAKAQETYNAAVGRLRLTLATLTRIAESMTPVRGRKNLMLVSEGFIMDTTQPEFRELVQAARRSNTAVNFLDARGTSGVLGEAGMPGGGAESGRAAMEQDATTLMAIASRSADGARNVALDTGGTIVPATAGLGREMARIADEARAYYLLGYAPANPRRDGSYRKINVEVSRPGKYTVRARRGYYAPRDNEKRADRKEGRLDPGIRAALDAPFSASGLPLRLTSYVSGPGTEGKASVLLLGEADVAALDLKRAGGVVRGAFETFVVVQSRDGSQPQPQEKLLELEVPEAQWEQVRRAGVPMRREFQLGPGVYQARLLVRERETGRLGTVRHEFEVNPATGLRVSSPILTDTFQAAAPGEVPRPLPVARRTFTAGGRLGFAYEVYGAAADPGTALPRLSAGYTVRRRDGGTVVASAAARPLRASSMAAVSQVFVLAAPGEPGDYDFVLTVTDEPGGVTTEVTEPFSIVAIR